MKLKYLLMAFGVLLLGVISLYRPFTAHAAPHATYALVRSSIVPGGSGSAGIYKAASSIGQPTAGEVSVGIYTLGGGFWGGGVIVPAVGNYQLFLPLVVK